jgi:hypothetical protein
MVSRGVTIDRIGDEAHERYALDQLHLEAAYVRDAPLVPPHSAVNSISALFPSSWELLFELTIRNNHWAVFRPPPDYDRQRKKFFSYCVAPSVALERDADACALSAALRRAVLPSAHGLAAFEKERAALLRLLDEVRSLDALLRTINAKKVQYQKG